MVAVIGVLAGIVVFAVSRTTQTAQEKACGEEWRIIRTALSAYKDEVGRYPTSSQGLAALVSSDHLDAAPSTSKWLYDPSSGDVVGIGPCLSLAGASTPKITGTVTVFAATSLAGAFGDLKAKLTAVNPSLNLVMSFGGTATLKNQINTSTSPADVFAAADTSNSPNSPLVGSQALFASNTLAIITRPGNPAGVTGLAGLFNGSTQVVLCQSAQPCGNAANLAFATIGRTRADLGTNLASETANVGGVVTAVAAGAPNTVGVAYVTDAIANRATVDSVAIPTANNVVNRYPIYRITSGPNATGAGPVINFVLSSEGRAILAARGFGGP